jgi:hypothetical protein
MRINPWLSAVIIAAVTLVILLPRLQHKSLWCDEAYYAQIAAETPKTIVFAAGNDFHPPGYLLAQHLMVKLFGASEFALRFLSALGWLGVVLLTWLWGTKVFNPYVGWGAALWAAVSYFGLITATNATSYALFAALSVGALFAFWWASERNGGIKAWILYALAQAACVYTHHYGWGTFAAVNLYFLITAKGRRKLWIPWLVANFAVVVLYLPLLSTTISQITLRIGLLGDIRPGGDPTSVVIRRIAGVLYHLGVGYVFHGPEWSKVLATPLFWVTAIVAFGMAIGGVIAMIPKWRPMLFLGIFLLVNVAGMVKSQADILSFPNLAPVYGLLAASAAVAWVGKKWWVAMIPLWLINCVGYGIFSVTTQPVIFSNTDFRAVVQRVESEIEPGDVVMTDLQRTGTSLFQYYYHQDFVARDHFDQYRYELCLHDYLPGRYQADTPLEQDIEQAFDNGAAGIWYITRIGLNKDVLEPIQDIRSRYPNDYWNDGETYVVKFYPKNQ